MNDSRKREQLAKLFALYLRGELVDEANLVPWDSLRKSSSQTIRHGCAILSDLIEDVGYDLHLLDKSEWDYIERVRLAIAGGADLTCFRKYSFGWRNILAAVSFFGFILLVIQTGVGLHLLPFTAMIAIAIFTIAKLFPSESKSSSYEKIFYPFATFSELSKTYRNADSFRKIRYRKNRGQRSWFAVHIFWPLVCATPLCHYR